MSLDAAVWDELADVRAMLAATVRREQAQAADLEQVRLFIHDALLCDDTDIGALRDYLHMALDVGERRAS